MNNKRLLVLIAVVFFLNQVYLFSNYDEYYNYSKIGNHLYAYISRNGLDSISKINKSFLISGILDYSDLNAESISNQQGLISVVVVKENKEKIVLPYKVLWNKKTCKTDFQYAFEAILTSTMFLSVIFCILSINKIYIVMEG